jgi:hypothetical protein
VVLKKLMVKTKMMAPRSTGMIISKRRTMYLAIKFPPGNKNCGGSERYRRKGDMKPSMPKVN